VIRRQIAENRRQRKIMKKLVLLFLLVGPVVSAQKVTFIEKNDTLQKPKYQEFIFLNDATDLSESVKVATIQSVGDLGKPVKLYHTIRAEAQKIGANSFRFVSFKKNEDKTGELVLAVFYTPDNILNTNFQHITNSIFIFGDDDLTSTKTQGYKVAGQKYEIGAGQFREFDLKPGEEVKVSKGGFSGMTLWVKYEPGKMSRFYSFSGIGVDGGGVGISSNGMGVGVGITTGTIHRVEQNLAMLLTKMYEEQK
jgi:hypothetical protein